ncbi:MAG: transglutaminase family protein [Planctomycetaceae bacterium]
MPIQVALTHITEYRYDRRIALGPQTVRLRPAPHSRTPINSYSLKIEPAQHFLNWQQDPHGNFLARLVFPEPTDLFRVSVDLVTTMTVINPFDFFIEEEATEYPFNYAPELRKDLQPFLECLPVGSQLGQYLDSIDLTPRRTIDLLVELNQRLQQEIRYLIRMEPGVQSPEETLEKRSGSCRDSAWLLAQILRNLGLAARFVSGYLIQLAPDQKSLDGPSGPEVDFTDLHAWTEVFLPGAGWIGLDATSGLLTGEGHIPLAATPTPTTAAPISGAVEPCESKFDVQMKVTRVHEDPRVTLPYTDEQWSRIDAVGHAVDARLQGGDVRLTMGGEPTFVSIDDMEGAEWTVAAVEATKQRLSDQLIRRLQRRFATGSLLHFGQGKWYPGESLPRWAYSCLWRKDGEPVGNNPELLADISLDYESGPEQAETFVTAFARQLGVKPDHIRPAYEDLWHMIELEQKLPVNVDPNKYDADDPEERRRLALALERGLNRPVGFVLPLSKAWWQANARWQSGDWRLRTEKLYLIPGDSAIGLRLPLESLPVMTSAAAAALYTADPTGSHRMLPTYVELRRAARDRVRPQDAEPAVQIADQVRDFSGSHAGDSSSESAASVPVAVGGWNTVRTAMCVEPRFGRLHVFMPPVARLEDYLELIAAVEETAEALRMPVVVEGYLPPSDDRISIVKVTPDPGVIEVNVHPAHSWDELQQVTTRVYEDARATRLGTEKFQLDGRHSGTGGGNHIVLGAAAPLDSPFLRRPDLLRSLIGYWNNHPSLSYLFAGLFIGPTSQSPRVDEGRRDAMYELETAFQQVRPFEPVQPWIVDRIFRHLLVDVTGNTHRAEICIDKLYSPDSSSGRLGLVELRSFEMPPHARMSLAQQLLVRGLIAMFWERPYLESLIHWETQTHDRFMLPWHLWNDLCGIIGDLRRTGFDFDAEWFAPHWEFRCPLVGEATYDGMRLELRQAIEPWYVLGEEPGAGGTARYVDSSVERMQLKVSGLFSDRYAVTCNGYRLPLQRTEVNGEYVAGVRYRAWWPPSCLHPTIPINTPLVFDIVDLREGRSLGGCTYYVEHPGGLNQCVSDQRGWKPRAAGRPGSSRPVTLPARCRSVRFRSPPTIPARSTCDALGCDTVVRHCIGLVPGRAARVVSPDVACHPGGGVLRNAPATRRFGTTRSFCVGVRAR